MFYSINRNSYIMVTIKLSGEVGKKTLEKMGYWVTENRNQNYPVPEF